MFFGKKLKKVRLKQGYGLRKFAGLMDMKPSELSKIERGHVLLDDNFMTQLKAILDISKDHEDWIELVKLKQEPFIMQKMKENVILSPFISKTDGTRLTEKEFRNLHEYINNIAKEHNKKADEYNSGKK